MPTIRYLLAPAVLLLATGAQAGDVEDAIDYRQGLMNVFAWNLGPMDAMVKGKTAFDAAAFRAHAKDLATAAQLDLLKGFPPDSLSDESDAKDEVWLSWSKFEEGYQALRDRSAKLAQVAASGDEAAMKEQFGNTAKTCKSCHEDFKNK